MGDFFCFSTFNVHCMLRSLFIKNLKKFDNIAVMKSYRQSPVNWEITDKWSLTGLKCTLKTSHPDYLYFCSYLFGKLAILLKSSPLLKNFYHFFCLFKDITVILSYAVLKGWNRIRTPNHLVYKQTLSYLK